MSLRLQVVIAIGAIAAILWIGNLVRIRRLELKYALIWFLVGILLLIFDDTSTWDYTTNQYADVPRSFVCVDDTF